jgi:hypothetical protein
LQEAIAYLAEVPCTASPDEVIEKAIWTCNLLREEYRKNRYRLVTSDDPFIEACMIVAATSHGEPLPKAASREQVVQLEDYVHRLGQSIYDLWSKELGQWLLHMYTSLGDIQPGGRYPFGVSQDGFELTWDAKLREVYGSCTGNNTVAAHVHPVTSGPQLQLEL